MRGNAYNRCNTTSIVPVKAEDIGTMRVYTYYTREVHGRNESQYEWHLIRARNCQTRCARGSTRIYVVKSILISFCLLHNLVTPMRLSATLFQGFGMKRCSEKSAD